MKKRQKKEKLIHCYKKTNTYIVIYVIYKTTKIHEKYILKEKQKIQRTQQIFTYIHLQRHIRKILAATYLHNNIY